MDSDHSMKVFHRQRDGKTRQRGAITNQRISKEEGVEAKSFSGVSHWRQILLTSTQSFVTQFLVVL